jgi:hypothetical protein
VCCLLLLFVIPSSHILFPSFLFWFFSFPLPIAPLFVLLNHLYLWFFCKFLV